jgi:serpin B
MKLTTFLTLATIVAMTACQQNIAQPMPIEEMPKEQQQQQQQEEAAEKKQIDLSQTELQMVSSNNNFAFNLFRTAQEDKSQILSPLSITYALSLLNNGAMGETQQEINQTLGFFETDIDSINVFCKKMLEESPTLDKGTKVLIGNTIYTNKGYTLKSDFVKKAKEYFDATPESRDFHDGKTLNVINRWASDHTNKMIEQVLDEQTYNPDAVSYLLNAIYFKGSWAKKFDKKQTKEEPFNGKGKVMMMSQEEKLYYADNEYFSSVELPYGNGSFRMTVMLPHEDKTIDDVLDYLSSKTWRDNGNWMRKCLVDLKLPRFETKTDMELNKIMQKLGITKAFTNAAEFDRFCDISTKIDLIKQVARIKLDEEGTEAAAVTVIGSKVASAAPREPERVVFHADRTFLYVISEQSSEAIFFIGKYTGQ